MAKYQKPVGFQFDLWERFKQFMTEKDIKYCEEAQKKAKEDKEKPCPKCGKQVDFITDIRTNMATRCRGCGYMRSHEPILTFKDEEKNVLQSV